MNGLLVGLQGVDIGAERECGRHVDRVAHQIGLQVDQRPGVGREPPSSGQPLRHLDQRRKVGLDVRGVETGHHHRTLAPPSRAIGRENAAKAHFVGDGAHFRAALKTIGTVAQDRSNRLGVGQDDEFALRNPDAKTFAVPLSPSFDRLMQSRPVDLQQVADDRQSLGAGQIADATRQTNRAKLRRRFNQHPSRLDGGSFGWHDPLSHPPPR